MSRAAAADPFLGWGYRAAPTDAAGAPVQRARPRTPHLTESRFSRNGPVRRAIVAALRANPAALEAPRVELVRELCAEHGVGEATARRAIAEAQGKPYAGIAVPRGRRRPQQPAGDRP